MFTDPEDEQDVLFELDHPVELDPNYFDDMPGWD